MTAMRLVFCLLAALTLGACAGGTGPDGVRATFAERDPDDAKLGAATHPKVLEEFGGIYRDPALTGYVTGLGARIAAVSEQPEAPWTFTVLDTADVNAFALPGGYVYVTRGLVALAQDEAELAGVIGHEIGHVTAGHSGLRQDRSMIASVGLLVGSLGLAVLGVDPTLARVAAEGAQIAAGGALASYSRADELAADNLGVRYLARAGYDPYAQADFMERLGAHGALEARIAGRDYDPAATGFFASHPATADRTREAIRVAEAQGAVTTAGADRRQDPLLDAIDGLAWGDGAAQGIVRGQRFVHPGDRVAMTFPAGFTVETGADAVRATGPGRARMLLQIDEDPGGSLSEIVERRWATAYARQMPTGELTGPNEARVGGLPAAEALLPVELRGRTYGAHLTAVRRGGSLYRITALVPQERTDLYGPMREAALGFRPMTEAEAATERPLRLVVITARPGDTVARLADGMPGTGLPEARFRLLNGLGPDEEVRPGQRLRVIR